MGNVVMKGLRFAYTQESCSEAWKRSHMCCSAQLCVRLADFQESRFQASKRSNMGSDVLEVGRSADIRKFPFQAAKRSEMDCVEIQGVYLLTCGMAYSGLETFRKLKYHLAREWIC